MKVTASPPVDPIEAAVVWINEYIENSRNFPAQYLKPSFVVPTLRPLLELHPFVPPRKSLQIITDINTNGGRRTLSPDRVISFTMMKSRSDLRDLAMDLGYDEGYVAWGAPRVMALVSPEWMVALTGPLRKSSLYSRRPKAVEEFASLARAGGGAEEVIGFVKHPTPLTDLLFTDHF